MCISSKCERYCEQKLHFLMQISKKLVFFYESKSLGFDMLHEPIFMFMLYTIVSTFKKYNSNKIEFSKKNIIEIKLYS